MSIGLTQTVAVTCFLSRGNICLLQLRSRSTNHPMGREETIMLKRKLIYPVLAMASAVAVLVAGPVQAWQPKKPVEFIIMAGTGGGADQIARLLQGLIEKKGLSSRPFIPINKPGGSGAEALRYMQDLSLIHI